MGDERYFACPYCGSENSLLVDPSNGPRQEFTNDCETCCRPILLRLEIARGEVISFFASGENE